MAIPKRPSRRQGRRSARVRLGADVELVRTDLGLDIKDLGGNPPVTLHLSPAEADQFRQAVEGGYSDEFFEFFRQRHEQSSPLLRALGSRPAEPWGDPETFWGLVDRSLKRGKSTNAGAYRQRTMVSMWGRWIWVPVLFCFVLFVGGVVVAAALAHQGVSVMAGAGVLGVTLSTVAAWFGLRGHQGAPRPALRSSAGAVRCSCGRWEPEALSVSRLRERSGTG